ncbi:MAG: hypothetical protein FWC16_00370 [Defluviitaleaceae bacterium]|nr:hypothetical protein [Defluviitaleaceae bacterium]MCL2273357.1 hypothetical protein [Defluviitaleaceae bacterium]
MSMVQLGAFKVSQASHNRAREIVNNKPQGTRKSTDEVLASLRKMMPGWTISTSKDDWQEGVRNIEIDERVLQRMAEDPDAMVKFKAIILDLEEAVPALEQWAEEHPDAHLVFKFDLLENGQLAAIAMMQTLMGQEVTTTFRMPEDQTTWSALINEKLNILSQNQVTDADGNRSWFA